MRLRPQGGASSPRALTRQIDMTIIDEIEELRTELRHCLLTAEERRQAETRLDDLRARDGTDRTWATSDTTVVSPRTSG